MPLAPGIDHIDLQFLGLTGVIATVVLSGPEGVALIDPGPSTTAARLRSELDRLGVGAADVRAMLLTHIHLDHAGGTGVLADAFPRATVFVHERGAPHMVDPTKLVASASRLYGADMERLWGEVRPVPRERLRVLGAADRLRVAGHELEVVWTPGHASHHVSYFTPGPRIAFVGDTAGICRQESRIVLPPTPPPDIDLEAWRASTDRILAWDPAVLFLTHFGPQPAPRAHVEELWRRLDGWSERVHAQLAEPSTDDERARQFVGETKGELERTIGAAEADAYAAAARFDLSWLGLARYWRKRGNS